MSRTPGCTTAPFVPDPSGDAILLEVSLNPPGPISKIHKRSSAHLPNSRHASSQSDDVVAVRRAIEEFDGLFRGVVTRSTGWIRVDPLGADPLQLLAAQGHDFIFAYDKKKRGGLRPA